MLSCGLSLQYCHKIADVFAWFSLYSNKLCIDITVSRSSALSTFKLFILLTNLVKGVQFLKYTFLSSVSAAIAAASAPCPMTVIFSSTKTYASL